MGGFRPRWPAVALSVLAASQLGHAIVYAARYGVDAGRVESAGVHAYYPALTAVLGAAVGAVVMFALLLVAAVRIVCQMPPGWRLKRSVRFLDVLALVFVLQLLIFVGQETIEALAAGHAVPSAGDLLLWGTLGQLPAAAIAAAVVAWLFVRLEEAWTALVHSIRRPVIESLPPAVDRAARPGADVRQRLSSACPAAFRKRGPPRHPEFA